MTQLNLKKMNVEEVFENIGVVIKDEEKRQIIFETNKDRVTLIFKTYEIRMTIFESGDDKDTKMNNEYHNKNFLIKGYENEEDAVKIALEIYEKIKFRNHYIYKRNEAFYKILEAWRLNDAYFDYDTLRLNFTTKNNQKFTPEERAQILKEFSQLDFVDRVEDKGRFIYIHHSSDIREQKLKYYN